MAEDRTPAQGTEDDAPGADVSTGGDPDRRLFREITGIDVDWRGALLVPILAVVTALAAGAVILAVSDLDLLRMWGDSPSDALSATLTQIKDAYVALFNGAFGDLQGIAETLTLSAPLILAGLSVALGFRAGLFNIGAEGQMVMGGLFAVYIGFTLNPTAWLGGWLGGFVHLTIAVLFGFIGGAIWGGIPGWLRAKTGAHEVITTIMMNFIALRLLDYLLKTSLYQDPGRTDPISKPVHESAVLPRLLQAVDRFFDRFVPWDMDWASRTDLRLHFGFLIAVGAAFFVYWLLFKSSVGFEFRAVGSNPDAAKYAGMSVTFLYIAVMAVAGGLAGIAGINQPLGLSDPARLSIGFTAGVGFDAIALALLGRSHPVGVVFAGILFGALRAGGQEMQAATSVSVDLVTVVGALIVMFIAAPALIRAIYRVRTGEATRTVTTGWGS